MFDHFTRSHFSLGRVLGIPVGLNGSWFAVFFLVSWTLSTGYFPQFSPDSAGWVIALVSVGSALAFFASILAHEFGHALAARREGIEVRDVTLFFLGGMSRIQEEPRTAAEEFRIAAAGPAVSAALALAGLALSIVSHGSPLFRAVEAYFVLVNVGLAAFNLVPALPLDGGRILRAAIWSLSGDSVGATRWCARGGRLCGFATGAVGLGTGLFGAWIPGFWLIVVGVFVERSASASGRTAEASRLRVSEMDLHSGSGGAVIEVRYRQRMRQVVAWRARLDVLPRPDEVSEDETGGRRFFSDRESMFDLLGRIDAAVRAQGDEVEIEKFLTRLSSLYEEWRPAVTTTDELEDDPGDSIAAGRPEQFAPTPEEVLAREPGSSAEV